MEECVQIIQQCCKNGLWEEALPTFVGALLGFIFSLALFYLQEKWKEQRYFKDLKNNIQNEIDFNIEFLKDTKEKISDLIQQISTQDKFIFYNPEFYKFQRGFILQAFNIGILYKALSVEDIRKLDEMLTYFNVSTDQLLRTFLDLYKNNTNDSAQSIRNFKYHKQKIEENLKVLQKLKKDLAKL